MVFMVSPVTHTAEQAVKNASMKGNGICVEEAKGKLNRSAPVNITNKKVRIIIWVGRTRNQVKSIFK